MIRHNEAFRMLHEFYTNRQVNPLRKKQSIVVLCGKLFKYSRICTKHRAFDANRMKKYISSLAEAIKYCIP